MVPGLRRDARRQALLAARAASSALVDGRSLATSSLGRSVVALGPRRRPGGAAMTEGLYALHLMIAAAALVAVTGPLADRAASRCEDRAGDRHGCAAHAVGKMQSHAIAVVEPGVTSSRRCGWTATARDDGFRAGQGAGGRRLGLLDRGHGGRRQGHAGFAFAPHVVTVAGGVPIFSADGKTGSAPPAPRAKRRRTMPPASRRDRRRGASLQPSLSKRRAASIGARMQKIYPDAGAALEGLLSTA